jgi:signal peptidase I
MISAANAFQVKPDRVRKMVQWTERFLAIIGLCFIIWHLCFELTVMTSASMAPTLNGTSYENGDRILLEKLSCRFRTPKRWEIYFYYDTDGNPVAKRVVGLPGERISIRTNAVCINGSPLSRPEARRPVSYYGYGSLANGQEVECGQGYFMLGDSSIDSYDSRYTGVVTRERFRGRVWCIIAPRAHVGFVE